MSIVRFYWFGLDSMEAYFGQMFFVVQDKDTPEKALVLDPLADKQYTVSSTNLIYWFGSDPNALDYYYAWYFRTGIKKHGYLPHNDSQQSYAAIALLTQKVISKIDDPNMKQYIPIHDNYTEEDVMQIVKMLQGLVNVPIDGKFGPETWSAVRDLLCE